MSPFLAMHTHSIELALKAYLRTRAITEAELKKSFRHGFIDLLAKCEELGLKFRKPKRTRELVNGYPVDVVADQGSGLPLFLWGAKQLPELHEMREGNERILAAVQPACVKSLKAG